MKGLDDWTPNPIKHCFREESEWRKLSHKKLRGTNLAPSLDDVRKVLTYVKNGVSEKDIKRIFNLSDATFICIKKGKFWHGKI